MTVEHVMSGREPVRLGIVGCGAITESSHLPAALRSPGISVAALVDADRKSAQRLARRFGLRCAVELSLEAVLSKIDGVIVATPNHTHAPVATVALEQGVPVLIEKPIATSYAEAIQLCELAESKGAFISVGYKSRFYPGVQLLKSLLERRFLGKILSFHYEFGSRDGWNPVSGYNLDRRQTGGGVLIGTHFVDRMLYWFGEPKGFAYADNSRGGPESNCKAELYFDNELGQFSGTFFLSNCIHLANTFILEAENYRCEIGDLQTESVSLVPRNWPDLRFDCFADSHGLSANGDYFRIQLEEFCRVVRQGGQPTVDGRFAARSVSLIEEMYKTRQQLPEPWLDLRSKAERTEGGLQLT